MKECMSCHNKVEELVYACPKCGGTTFLSSGPDAMAVFDAMEKKAEAKKHNDLGGQLFQQGHYAEAEAECKKAVEANPYNATAYSNVGFAISKQGRLEESIPWLEKALSINPRLEGASEGLVKIKAEIARKKKTPGMSQKSQASGAQGGKSSKNNWRPVLLGVLGLFVGYFIYLMIDLFSRGPVDSSLGGFMALAVGVIFFFVGRSRNEKPETAQSGNGRNRNLIGFGLAVGVGIAAGVANSDL